MITPHVTLVLSADATFTGTAHDLDDGIGPVGSVRFGEGGTYIAVSATSVAALLRLADEAQEAARRLRRLQLDAEARRAVA